MSHSLTCCWHHGWSDWEDITGMRADSGCLALCRLEEGLIAERVKMGCGGGDVGDCLISE